jgi:hypothetical protein
MTRHALLLIAILLNAFAGLGHAASSPVDVDHSSLKIRVYKSGFFSGFAHDHEMVEPLSSGRVDPAALSVEVHFDARKMTVLDSEASPADRAQVQETMLSDKVLDAQRFPEIGFVSRSVKASGTNAYSVEGDLTLHGVTHAVKVPVSFAGGHYTGSVKLKQSEFGIVPIKLFAGSVKVKDMVEISFDIVVR